MYEFVNFSRDVAATPFLSVISQFCVRISTRATANTHETACPAFKGSLMMKADVGIVVAAIVGM